MRVTANTFPNSLIDQLNRLATRQYRLQNQAATGQRITTPDDDPVAMRRVLDMQGEASSVGQYLRNVARNQELASASFAPIRAVGKVVDRASEIAVLADGLKSPTELKAYAAEVDQLIGQALELVNSRNRGDSLFGGTRADVAPFSKVTDAEGKVVGVTYHGNTTLAENEIASGVNLTAQTLGANTTGTGPRGLITDSRTGADLFNHLISLRDNLLAGDVAAIASVDRPALEADSDSVVYHLGTNASVQARLETSQSLLKQRSQSLEGLISKEADADLAQTLVRLNEVQTAYQAALQSGGTILGRSLMDYIR
ncbi:MAG: flagellin [Verrucomicrobiae bacterium]|nr:flagellin [Verrucomicrobiae bacterium]